MTSPKSNHYHPDGGCLAWTIVAASFMVSFLQDGFRDSFGLILPSISDHFGVGRAESALTNSIMTALTLGSGPLVALLVKKWGHRNTTLLGVSLSSLGLFLSGAYINSDTMPHNILVLYGTVGVMTGLGFGLMYLPAMDIVEVYFKKNLGLATGIAAAGSGFGQFSMAPLIHLVEEDLGLGNTLYILGGVVSTSTLFALVYRLPYEEDTKSQIHVKQGINNMAFQFEEEQIRDKEKKAKLSIGDLKTIEEPHVKDEGRENQFVQLFKSPQFMILLISHFFMHLGIFAAFTFSTDRALTFGMTRTQTSILLSIMGVFNCIGRIVFGKLLDRFRSRAILMTFMVLLLNAVSITASTFIISFRGQALYSAVFGATFGAYISSVVVTLKMIVDDITVPLGVCLFTFALASLAGPTLVGHLYDVTSSYTPGFVTVGVLSVAAALLFLVLLIVPKKKTKNSELHETKEIYRNKLDIW